MADREDQPPGIPGAAAEGLSADEADRLSEKFRPSWEVDEDKLAPPPPPPPPAAPSAEAQKFAKQTLIGGLSPFAPEPATVAAPPEAAPAPAPARPAAKQTLIGIAPVTAPSALPPAAPPAAAPPAAGPAQPSGPVTAGGSPDAPRGIAKVYHPKDHPAAPPVVLTDELKRAEAATSAELESQRRAQSSQRRMQTVVNIKAPDIPGLEQPRRKAGLWQLLLGIAVGIAVVGAVFKLTASDDSPAQRPAAAPATPVAPEPPAVVVPAPRAEDIPPPPAALPTEAASSNSAVPNARASKPEPAPTSAPQAARAPARRKPTPKTDRPVAKDPASPSAPKKGVIIRDTPF